MNFEDINKKRTEILEAKRTDMKKFNRLPKGYHKWLDETLFDDHFMIYNNKTRTAHCTLCGKSHTMPKGVSYKNNYTGKCPICNRDVVYHRYNMKTGKTQCKWSLLIQTHENEVLLRYVLNTKRYNDDYTDYEISYEEKIRNVIGAEFDRTWQYFWGSDTWLPWRDEQFDFYHRATELDLALNGFTVYKPNLIKNTLKNTWAKYSGVEEVAKMKNFTGSNWRIYHYLKAYRQKPWLEKLAKVGFEKLLDRCVASPYTRQPFSDGSTLSEVLGMSNYQTKLMLHCKNPTKTEFDFVQNYPNVSMEFFDELRNSKYMNNNFDFMLLKQYAPLQKLLRYFIAQDINLRDYNDYLRWLTELGYDTSNKGNLFPKNFADMHDKRHIEYQDYLNAKKQAEMARFNALIGLQKDELNTLGIGNYTNGKLMIVIPNGTEDLKHEGESLHHCVATYAERVANKETMIFFVRHIDEPQKPYYTLEWNGEIKQCRGFGNQDMTEDVETFVNGFDRELNLKLSA